MTSETKNLPALPSIRLHRIPGWFRAAVYAANREGRWKFGKPGLMTTWQLLDAAHSQDYGLFDHWGETTDGKLASEPYQKHDDPAFLARVKRFANLLNLDYRVQKESEWNPPSTIRVTFWRKDESAHDHRRIRRLHSCDAARSSNER